MGKFLTMNQPAMRKVPTSSRFLNFAVRRCFWNRCFWNQCIACCVSAALALNPLVSVADVAVDSVASVSNQAALTNAGNQVPIVDIVTPTAQGVSHNKFKRFDIPTQGLILNNSRAAVDTQLAGHVNANPNLTDRAARIILNEVTSNKRSVLDGLAEIAGQSAEFVLANPNGITCSGCGFINTPRATLVTGVPVLSDGDLHSLSVTGGDVAITRLNASGIDRLDLFSRAISVNNELQARQLNIVTGRNDIQYSDLAIDSKSADGSDAPTFALDVAALGGMYANQIFMVGTESGLGVNMEGEMASDSGDISLRADGSLTLNKVISGGNLVVESRHADVLIEGNTYAKEQTRINASQGNLYNRGNLISEQDLVIAAGSLTNAHSGAIQSFGAATVALNGNFNNQTDGVLQGAFTANGELSLTANNIFNNGVLGGADSVTLSALNTLENSAEFGAPGSIVFSAGDLNLYGQTLINRQSDVFGLGNVVIAADVHGNPAQSVRNSSATLESLGNLSVVANEFVNHRQGVINVDNTTYCESGGMFCGVAVTDAAFDYGFSYSDRLEDAWLLPELGHFVELDWADETDWDNLNPEMRALYATLVERVLPSSRNSEIYSGGDFNILAGSFRNEGGFISVANNLNANVTSFANVSRMAVMPAPFSWPEHGEGWLDRFQSDTWFGDYGIHLLFFEGRIVAGDTIAVNATDTINNGKQFIGVDTPRMLPDLPLPEAPENGAAETTITEQLTLAISNPFDQFLELPSGSDFDRIDIDIVLPPAAGSGGLFGYTDPETGQGQTLIATNPSVSRFINIQGSDYLLELLGLDPDETNKRLGDGFYESRLIRQAIVNNTGNRFLDNRFASDAQQYRYLMNNAARAAEGLQLSVGVALTQQQLKNLTHDMVWLVNKEVNGETVLVPTLYLARVRPGTLDSRGATLSAQNVILNSGGTIANINGIRASDNLALLAEGDITNHGGEIAGGQVAIVSTQGDFTHASDSGKTATLFANKNLSIQAGRDINVLGSEVHSDGYGQLSAGRDITIESTLAESDYHHQFFSGHKNGVVSRYTTTEQRHDAQMGINGEALVIAGRDFNSRGAQLSVGGDAALVVARDINIESVTNRTTDETREVYTEFETPKRRGLLGVGDIGLHRKDQIRSDVLTVTETYTEQKSRLNVAGNLDAHTGNDINLIASDVIVDGNSQLDVGGNLSMVSVNDHSETHSQTRNVYIKKLTPLAQSSDTANAGSDSAESPVNTPYQIHGSDQKADDTFALERSSAYKIIETENTSSATELASNRALLRSGGNVVIRSAGGVANRSSDLFAGKTEIISRASIENTDGAVINGEDLLLVSGGDIENSGGSEIKGNAVALIAGGDVRNRRDAETTELRHGNFITTDVSDSSDVTASIDLTVQAGGDIINLGSSLSVGGNADLEAAGNIIIGAVADRERRADDPDDITDDTRHSRSYVAVDNALAIHAQETVAIHGSKVDAGGTITITAGNNVELVSATDSHYRFIYEEDDSGLSRSSETTEILQTTNIASEVSSLAGIDITASEDISIKGSSLTSAADIAVEAEGQITIEAAREIYDYYHEKSSSRVGGLISSGSRTEHFKENYVGANSKSAGDTAIISQGDISVVASRITSDRDIDITSSGGQVALLAEKNVEQYSHHEESNGTLKLVVKGEGYTDEITRHTELFAARDLTLQAAQGFVADFHQQEGETLRQSIARLATDNQQLQWMQSLSLRDDVDWNAIQEVHERWEYEHTGISTMGALLLQIVVAVALPGAGTALVDGAFGAGTVTAGSGTAAAINTGFNTLVTMASGSLITNGGDIGATLDDLASNASIKHLLVKSLSAGVGLTDAPATEFAAEDILAQSVAAINPEAGRLLNFTFANNGNEIAAVATNFAGESLQYLARKEVANHAERLGMTAEELNLLLMLNSYLGREIAGTSYLADSNLSKDTDKKAIYGFLSRDDGWLGQYGASFGVLWDVNDSILNSQGYIDAVAQEVSQSGVTHVLGHSLGAWRANNLVRRGYIESAEVLALPIFDYPALNVEGLCGVSDGICGGRFFNYIRSNIDDTETLGRSWNHDIFVKNHKIGSVPGYLNAIENYYEERH